jgi:hypothetical protein
VPVRLPLAQSVALASVTSPLIGPWVTAGPETWSAGPAPGPILPMAWEGAADQKSNRARVKIIKETRRDGCFFIELILFNKDGLILDRANYNDFGDFSQRQGNNEGDI